MDDSAVATATPQATAAAGAGAGGMNILSDKVQRALQVRTDTPAMKAALEALGQLDNNHGSSSGLTGGGGSGAGGNKPTSHKKDDKTSSSNLLMAAPPVLLDARSVRHAIEYDALQQALLLQDNLSSLVTTIRDLRQGISDVATLAHDVQQAISSNVVTETTRTSMISISGTTTTATTTADGSGGSSKDGGENAQQQQQQYQYQNQQAEERLAATIAEAFQRRNVARHRLQAVTTFLETFDLSEKDSRLLDHYNFEDMHATATNNINYDNMHHHPNNSVHDSSAAAAAAATAPNGMAFLRALERVWKIRRALVKTFGSGSGSGLTSGSFMLDSGTVSSNSFDGGGGGEKSITSGGGGLGASSALRMMESLAQKQEHAYERLYRTFVFLLKSFLLLAFYPTKLRKKRPLISLSLVFLFS
jgi:conserved oligomeric Golgi complex subunit 6